MTVQAFSFLCKVLI